MSRLHIERKRESVKQSDYHSLTHLSNSSGGSLCLSEERLTDLVNLVTRLAYHLLI